ncbi:hypothetical protein C3747_23g109 [Trypanosoma cruzi]|uniref:MutL C-terminal dimerisation domain-containing protein n=2 Tax=Trypanosoma cruzi TaxID=5693 RepID=Q4E1L4_TRYCC|nr:hypothetical protein, conserved [Trypanosoma cruzi]EAN98658.1 hypothetical protein, conserved [Trypanosoma cruzi]PWV16450.1 hypothetical protein C3747_23g109 [Trypanosoma cruzi]RNC47668.1 hypothetical protein TcCL_NonESM02433 [Trypanosoma cruzi]|eukprot:XP_820509.1 hypothetical protein [Trypanosoma cruzi strain CL Brener]
MERDFIFPASFAGISDQQGVISVLQRHDAVRVRAAHRIPSFSVAVEVVYQFLRSLPPPLRWSIREVRVVAAPSASNFTVELTSECQRHAELDVAKLISCHGEEAERMSDLTAVSQEVRLTCAVESSMQRTRGIQDTAHSTEGMGILFEGHWKGKEINKGEDHWNGIPAVLTTKLQAYLRLLAKKQKEHQPSSLFFHLRCEVRNLFYCMPVRQRCAAGWSYTSYRLRAERQALLLTAYRMAVECVFAPLYLSLNEGAGSSASFYLHLSNSGDGRNKAAYDNADVFYVHNYPVQRSKEMVEQLKKRRRMEPESKNDDGDRSCTLRTAHRILFSFFPHLRLCGESLECSNGIASSRLREVVVDPGKFVVLFLIPAWDTHDATRRVGRRPSALGTVVVCRHTESTACYVVDESHRIYLQVLNSFTTLCPIIVFLEGNLLESNDATLRRMFQSAERKYLCGLGTDTPRAIQTPTREDSLSVVGKLMETKDASGEQKIVGTALRVSFLAQRLSSVNGTKRARCFGGAPISSFPRRTPFFPINLGRNLCGTSTLSQVRSAMHLTIDPSLFAPRAYSGPSVWPGSGEMENKERTPCPFRAKHLIAQWDRKFLLLQMNDVGEPSDTSPFDEIGSPSSTSINGMPTMGVPPVFCKQAQSHHLPPPALYIVDPHAIHERLRLEFFLTTAESYVRRDIGPISVPVHIPEEIRRDVTTYEDFLARWGWRFAHENLQCTGIRSAMASKSRYTQLSWCCVAVTQWPHLEIEGHVLQLETIDALRKTVEELVTVLPSWQMPAATEKESSKECDWIVESPGARVVPSAVLEFLVTRSCRGAVMFGDSLSTATMAQLIGALQAVEQYTLCSHGRPSFAVIHRRKM